MGSRRLGNKYALEIACDEPIALYVAGAAVSFGIFSIFSPASIT